MRGAVVKSALISVILGAFVLLNSMNFASAGQISFGSSVPLIRM